MFTSSKDGLSFGVRIGVCTWTPNRGQGRPPMIGDRMLALGKRWRGVELVQLPGAASERGGGRQQYRKRRAGGGSKMDGVDGEVVDVSIQLIP